MWTSKEKCTKDDKQNHKFKLNVICDQKQYDSYTHDDATEVTIKDIDFDNQLKKNKLNDDHVCDTVVDFYGYEGCEIVDLTDILGPIAYASGFVQILLGLPLLLFGRTVLNSAIILLIFL